jgi:hypothetical protein
MEGLTLVGLFMEGTILTCLETYSDAKKRTLYATSQRTTKVIYNSYMTQQLKNCINLEVHQGVVVFQLYYRLGDVVVERGDQQTSYIIPAMKNDSEMVVGCWRGHILVVHSLLGRPPLYDAWNDTFLSNALSVF